jgi:cobalt-zinc-cadmium efflux system protein
LRVVGPLSGIQILRNTIDALLESTPEGIDLTEVRAHILRVEPVRELHDVHASLVATDLPVVTAHVVVDDACFQDDHLPALLDQLQACLGGCFDVNHSTFQFEKASHTGHEHSVC